MEDVNSFIGKFMGPNKIEEIGISSTIKTPSGKPIVRVTYQTHSEVIPLTTVMLLATPEATDLTSLQVRKFAFIIPQIMAVIEETDVTGVQAQSLLLETANALEAKFNRALNYSWYKDDRRFSAGYQSKNDFTLSEASEIIAQIPPRDVRPVE